MCGHLAEGQFCGYTYPVLTISVVGLGSPGCSTATQRPMLAARGHATVRGELACTWHCRTPRLAVARCRPGGAVRDIFESHGTPGFGGARPDGPSTALALDTQCGSRSTGWPWGVSARQLPPMAATAAIGADGAVADVTEGRLRAALGQLPAALGQLRHEPPRRATPSAPSSQCSSSSRRWCPPSATRPSTSAPRCSQTCGANAVARMKTLNPIHGTQRRIMQLYRLPSCVTGNRPGQMPEARSPVCIKVERTLTLTDRGAGA